MTAPFFDSSAPPVLQSDLVELAATYRIQGDPLLRLTHRATRGGGFGDPAARPYAWAAWVMVDGQWRQVISARGLPREWTSLDRAEAWLHGLGFYRFSVERPAPEPPAA